MGTQYHAPVDLASLPKIGAKPASLELTPDRDVEVVFRGGPQIHDLYDGEERWIPERPDTEPSDWTDAYGRALEPRRYPPDRMLPAQRLAMPFAMAQYFKARAVVPGTRDPHRHKTTSQLAIPRIDRPADCVPFSDAYVAHHWAMTEALNRDAYESPSSRTAVVMDADQAIAAVMAAGLDVDQVVEAEARSPEAVAPSSDPSPLEQIQRDEAAFARDTRGTERVSHTKRRGGP